MVSSSHSVLLQNQTVDILLVDNRQLVRSGIERILTDSGYITVAGEASSCDEAIRLTRNHQPAIILINLPGSTVEVLDGVRKLGRQFPDVRILVLHEEAELVVQERLLQAGVAGCLSAYCSVSELFSAIDTLRSGQRYLSDSLAQKLAERQLQGSSSSPFDQLTHRELQILLLIVGGKNSASIARQLCLTQKTINGYRNRLLEKLQVHTEVELMYLAARHGLVHLAVCS